MSAIELSSETLEAAKLDARIALPTYRRSSLSAGIVHFGVGNFHRAHQACYLDALFNQGRDLDWAIVGAGVLPSDRHMRQVLLSQDCLSLVVAQDNDSTDARVIGSILDFIEPGDTRKIIDTLASDAIRIVSLTVTEGGYFINAASGAFDVTHPQMIADAGDPDNPSTVFGLMIAALECRRAQGIAPFTVMSCDNIPHNGVVARRTLAGLARLRNEELADWIETSVSFPNSMVDRITPATGDRERELASSQFNLEDVAPVFCESFCQWVLEDKFPSGRPALEKVGVQFVEDVTPYENMKIRVLNGGHAVIAYPAGLLDIHYVHDAIQHPEIAAYLRKIEIDEIIPTLSPIPGVDVQQYLNKVEQRLANVKVGDTVRRLCLDGSNRQPKFVIPTIRDRLRVGAGIDGVALESALWCRYCYGLSEGGVVIPPNDPNWERLVKASQAAKDDPAAWLAMADIYGDVAAYPLFQEVFAAALTSLWRRGVVATLTDYLNSTPFAS